jgi:hypothetical protein
MRFILQHENGDKSEVEAESPFLALLQHPAFMGERCLLTPGCLRSLDDKGAASYIFLGYRWALEPFSGEKEPDEMIRARSVFIKRKLAGGQQ